MNERITDWNGARLRRLMDMQGWDEATIASKVKASERSVENWLGDRCKMSAVYADKLNRIEAGVLSQRKAVAR